MFYFPWNAVCVIIFLFSSNNTFFINHVPKFWYQPSQIKVSVEVHGTYNNHCVLKSYGQSAFFLTLCCVVYCYMLMFISNRVFWPVTKLLWIIMSLNLQCRSILLLQAKYPLPLCRDLRFADRKSRSFKTYLFEFSQAKLCYYKDRSVSIKNNKMNLRMIILWFECVDVRMLWFMSYLILVGFSKSRWVENWRHSMVLGIWT